MKKHLIHVSMMPQARAAGTLSKLIEPVVDENTGEIALADFSDILIELMDECKNLRSNNLCQTEDMLSAHTQVLDALFHKLTGDALKSEYLEHIKTLLLLALRVQSQCRSTAT